MKTTKGSMLGKVEYMRDCILKQQREACLVSWNI